VGCTTPSAANIKLLDIALLKLKRTYLLSNYFCIPYVRKIWIDKRGMEEG